MHAFIHAFLYSFAQQAFLGNDYEQGLNWVGPRGRNLETRVLLSCKGRTPSGISLVLAGARFQMFTNLFLFRS